MKHCVCVTANKQVLNPVIVEQLDKLFEVALEHRVGNSGRIDEAFQQHPVVP